MAKSTERKHTIISGKRLDEVILTQEQAIDFGNKWRVFLGLTEWILDLNIKRAEDMPLKDVQGTVGANENKQMIFLDLLSPLDYTYKLVPQNHEKTIIHELLHVTLYPFNIKKKLHIEEERFIEKLSHALYEQNQGRCP